MKRIFITGASGCIGHYLAEALIEETEHELFFLIRNPDKLKFNSQARAGIHLLKGDMQEIEQYSDLLKTIDVAILAATTWGGIEETHQINVVKTLTLMKLLDPLRCEQVFYFSTASILNRKNQPMKEAGELGTTYISSKYECYTQLSTLKIAPKITTLFPTFVLGGDENKPFSHVYSGLPDVLKWIDLIRWFKADGSFHFLHARDIAQVVRYLIDNPAITKDQTIVLGNQRITVNEAIAQICAYLHKRIYFQIPLSISLANIFIKIFRLKMQAWDKFSLEYRHFTHEKTYSPATFGLTNYCSTLEDALRLRGIYPR
ncbi:NAD-dependent epimerase/dehydratase family protein [Gloeothece verrucosa]|uniref:NmrA family protein n=1 Tax=Gloeothece verrucosa (strain PCC 7822) TaxID=497965 RepID=E0UE13_GLOV7|nr:NAD(P)-dependent oxidoreductase [Gloeothece verrucosa]ADN13017.1 NmrA family protein [Gloeothece verrucosa PCC 7822]